MSDKEQDPDEGFEIVDRRTRGSEETESEAPAEEPSDEASGEADEPDDLETALPPEVLEVLVPSSVESVLHGAFTHLARLAWESTLTDLKVNLVKQERRQTTDS